MCSIGLHPVALEIFARLYYIFTEFLEPGFSHFSGIFTLFWQNGPMFKFCFLQNGNVRPEQACEG